MTGKNNSGCAPIVWQRRYPEGADREGFTLVELLMAIAIFALLVSILMGSFNGVFTPTEALTTQRRNTAMAQSCLDRMAVDLKNIYVELPPVYRPTGINATPPVHRFAAGDALGNALPQVLLQLPSKIHITARPGKHFELAVIRYYLEPVVNPAETIYRLRRSDTLLIADDHPDLKNDPILCDNIKALHIRCLDAEGEPHESWDSATAASGYATPRSVSIQLELRTSAGPQVYQTTISLPVWRKEIDRL